MSKYKAAVVMCGVFMSLVVSGCISQQNQVEPDRGISFFAAPTNSIAASDTVKKDSPLPELTENSGLSDYLAYAALKNPGLEAAFNIWKAALDQIPQVKALPDPRFNYKYFIEEVETRVGPQQQSFGISQVFPWFGKLKLRGDVAAEAANAAMQRYEAVKLKLFFKVKDAYYEYYYLAKSVGIAEENIILIKHLESVAESRYRSAVGSHPDVIRAQVELGKLEDRYQTLLDLKGPLVARLNAALNRPIEIDLPWPKEIEYENVEVADTQLLAKLLNENPELKALSHEVIQNRHNIDLAKKDYYPDFNLGIDMIDTGNSPVGNPSDNGKDPVVAMVSINLPIWTEKYDAGVRQARSRYYAAQHQKKERANSLSSELKMVLYQFRDAERKVGLYRDTLVPKATESLNVTESGFRAAKSSFTDLIDAQRILLEFALSYERALANRSQSLAKLEMLIGQKISTNGN